MDALKGMVDNVSVERAGVAPVGATGGRLEAVSGFSRDAAEELAEKERRNRDSANEERLVQLKEQLAEIRRSLGYRSTVIQRRFVENC